MSLHPRPLKAVEKAKAFATEYVEISKRAQRGIDVSVPRAQAAEYARYRARLRINDRMVLYESFFGRGITDNPYAIFLYLLDNPSYKGFTHVWCVNDLESSPEMMADYTDRKDVKFVEFGSTEYIKALASAKYLINNVTFPAFFAKREGQVYVNTWHGTPLKSMGYEQVGGNVDSANTVRNFLHADYLLSANPIMTRMYLESYKLKDILPGIIIEEGYPRNDLLVSTPESRIVRKLARYGIHVDGSKTLVVYAPTWRQGSQAKAVVNGEELLGVKRALEDVLDPDSYQILVKPHQFVYNALKDDEAYKGLLVPSTIDSNELLSITDILVSDYSSIFLDYMVLNRPIVFYTPDSEGYTQDRGLAYSLDELPGPYATTLDELSELISRIDDLREVYRARYESIRSTTCGHDDGNVTERIVKQVFGGGYDGAHLVRGVHDKRRLLISVGIMFENGIVHSFLSLLHAIDYEQWDVTAYVSVQGNDLEMRQKVNEGIDPRARVLMRVGPPIHTKREQVRREFIEERGLYRPWWKRLYPKDSMQLEFHRAFGDASFDHIVDFCGYSRFYVPMLAEGDAKTRSIWLHNDMKADMNKVVMGEKKNFTSLHMAISLYPYYDRLVSCGRQVCEVNREKLATPETYDKFTFAKNTFNTERFAKHMQEDDVFEVGGVEYLITQTTSPDALCRRITYIELPNRELTNFVTMGRFSTEKNHARLIKAFARYVEDHPLSKLYIIGGGPLEKETASLIKKLDMQDKIILTGRLGNPYSLMRRCDCFVLPSIHEGQPLVLLEARACKLPIIVSNFSSVKDSLIEGGQLVIDSSEDGIYEGLLAFSRGEVPTVDFDIDEYNQAAYQEFINAII